MIEKRLRELGIELPAPVQWPRACGVMMGLNWRRVGNVSIFKP